MRYYGLSIISVPNGKKAEGNKMICKYTFTEGISDEKEKR